MFTINIIECTATPVDPANVSVNTITLRVPCPVPSMSSWQDFFAWLREHPEIITMLISAILSLLGAASATLKAPQK